MSKIMMLVCVSCVVGVSSMALEAAAMPKVMDCSTMSPEMQQFASQMTPENKAMFCGKFTDGQRASAMQMASTPDTAGMMPSPDEAVQKVAGASGSTPKGKVPTGCPVE